MAAKFAVLIFSCTLANTLHFYDGPNFQVVFRDVYPQEPSDAEWMSMNHDGRMFNCSIPTSGEDAGESTSPEPLMTNDTSVEPVRKLLDKYLGGRCMVKASGWWTFEFCYNKWLRQYHSESQVIDGKDRQTTLQEYDLGLGPEAYASDAHGKAKVQYADGLRSFLEQHHAKVAEGAPPTATGDLTFHSEPTETVYSTVYGDGTPCGGVVKSSHIRQRTTTVMFYCTAQTGQNEGFFTVDEPNTCTYVLKLHTTAHCGTIQDLSPTLSARKIVCYPPISSSAESIPSAPLPQDLFEPSTPPLKTLVTLRDHHRKLKVDEDW